jgi:hypothetical protein
MIHATDFLVLLYRETTATMIELPMTVQQIAARQVRRATAMRVGLTEDARLLVEESLRNRVFHIVKVASAPEVRLYCRRDQPQTLPHA